MKRFAFLLSCVSLFATSAHAEPPTQGEVDAGRVVERVLVAPLKARDDRRRSYSRVASPPTEMRVRVLDNAAKVDTTGAAFWLFAVDSRRGRKAWQNEMLTGCVYPKSGVVYVRQGEVLKTAGVLLDGSKDVASPDACREAIASAR